jgi:hypothetical protein
MSNTNEIIDIEPELVEEQAAPDPAPKKKSRSRLGLMVAAF